MTPLLGAAPPTWAAPPPLLAGPGTGGAEPLRIPKPDNYSLRLVSGRRLYDAGSAVTGSPSLTPLVPALVARANPYDLDRLGAGPGTGCGSARPGASWSWRPRPTTACPRACVAVDFNVPERREPGQRRRHAHRRRQLVTDVRLESV